MKKQRLNNLIRIASLVIIICIFTLRFTVSAKPAFDNEVPFQSYTYWFDSYGNQLVNSKAMYKVKEVINVNSLGTNVFIQLSDMCTDSEGYVYLVDSDAKEITVINSEHKLESRFNSLTNKNGESIALTGPRGIYVSDKGNMYICDTAAGIVYVCNRNAQILSEIAAPDASILPDGFVYRPLKVAVDADGYTYVLSEGSYYGAMIYKPDGSFLGFYGANTVKSTVTQFLKNLWDKLTMTNEKRANSLKSIPYVFTDLCVDNGGFVYTVTGSTDYGKLQQGVLRRLSPIGVNIMQSDDVVFGDHVVGYDSVGSSRTQNLSNCVVDDDGFIYLSDTTSGNVYVYDGECNLLTAFGGGGRSGTQNGVFTLPCAIDLYGEDIYVCDSSEMSVTIFTLTEYGKTVKSLQKETLAGNYSETMEGWKQVLSQDRNSQLAYVGIGKAALQEKDYETALEYSRLGLDRDTYERAYEQIRGDFLSRNFTLIFVLAVLLIATLIAVSVFIKKKHIRIKNQAVSFALGVNIHPFALFRQVREKKYGSIKIGLLFTVLFYISEVAKNDFGGFLFTSTSATNFNSIVILVRTAGAVLIWTVVNWMVSTLFGGLGKVREIFIVTTYSLTPMIIANVIYMICSNFMLGTEGAFLSVLMIVAEIYTVMLLCVGTMVTHDFSFGKFVVTALLSLLGLLLVVFLIAATIILVQQLYSFFSTIFYEIIYR